MTKTRGEDPLIGERRWPMAIAVLATGGLFFVIPEEFRLSNLWHYFYLAFIVALLLVLIIGDPGRINRESKTLRIVTGVMLGLITLVTAISALRLVAGIVRNAHFETPGHLLMIGILIQAAPLLAHFATYTRAPHFDFRNKVFHK